MTVNDSDSDEGGRPSQQDAVGQAPPSRSAHRKQVEAERKAEAKKREAKKREAKKAEAKAKKPWYRSFGGALKLVLLVVGIALLWPSSLGSFTGLTVVEGHSMEPTYYTGDIAVTLRQSSYEVGDIISYKVSEGQQGASGRVIHRIIAVSEEDGQTVYTTQGDNNDSADIWVVTNRDIQGKAVGHVKGIGKFFGGQTYGLIIALTAAIIVTVVLRPSDKKKGEDDDEDKPKDKSSRKDRRGETADERLKRLLREANQDTELEAEADT